MIRARSVAYVLIVVLIIVTALRVNIYRSDSISFQVIDATNAAPIEGAIIAADWVTTTGHGIATSEFVVLEKATGAQGKATLPAWGPKVGFSAGSLSAMEPTIRIVKLGYIPQLVNGLAITRSSQGQAKFILTNGPIELEIRLQPFQGSAAEYGASFSAVTSSLLYVLLGLDCAWKDMPLLLTEITNIKAMLKASGAGGSLFDRTAVINQEKCGSATEFFEGHDLRNTSTQTSHP